MTTTHISALRWVKQTWRHLRRWRDPVRIARRDVRRYRAGRRLWMQLQNAILLHSAYDLPDPPESREWRRLTEALRQAKT